MCGLFTASLTLLTGEGVLFAIRVPPRAEFIFQYLNMSVLDDKDKEWGKAFAWQTLKEIWAGFDILAIIRTLLLDHNSVESSFEVSLAFSLVKNVYQLSLCGKQWNIISRFRTAMERCFLQCFSMNTPGFKLGENINGLASIVKKWRERRLRWYCHSSFVWFDFSSKFVADIRVSEPINLFFFLTMASTPLSLL